MKEMTDFIGRTVSAGDTVFILDSIQTLNEDFSTAINSIKIGEVVDIENEEASVKIEEGVNKYALNKIAKLNPEESVDDIIIRLANDFETLQLMQESEILNSMLQPTRKGDE